MSKQRHIIGRTVLELDTKQLADVWSLQEDVSSLFQQQGMEEIARLFDQLVPDEEVVRLDQLVVDIGSIDRRFLADEFIHKLLDALRETLGDRLSNRLLNHNQAIAETITRDGSDWQVLLYFLRYGRLPWWCPIRDWSEWLPRWLAVMQTDTNWRHDLRELLINYPAAQQRLVEQLPEDFRHQLVLHLQPTWINWHSLLTQAKQLMQSLALDSGAVRYLEQQAWLLLFGEITGDNTTSRGFPANWTHNWLAQLVSIWRHSAREQKSRGNSPENLYQIASQRLRAMLTEVPNGEQSLWLTALDEALTSMADITQPNPSEIFTTPSEQSQEEETEQVHTPQTDGEMLLYFLQYGRFPGEQLSANWQEWLSRWSVVVQSDIGWQLPLRRLLREKPEVRRRLVTQLPEDLRYQLLLQLQPDWGNWRILLAEARLIMQSLEIVGDGFQELEKLAIELLLVEIGSEESGKPLSTATWMRNWLTQLMLYWRWLGGYEEQGFDDIRTSIDAVSPDLKEQGEQRKRGKQGEQGEQGEKETFIHGDENFFIGTDLRSLWLTAYHQVLNLTFQQTSITPPQNPEDSPRSDGEMLLYFLQYGRFPGEQSSTNWQEWLLRWSVAVQSDIGWQLPLRQLLRVNPEARRRLVTQLPEDLRYQLLLQLQPSWGNWRNLLTQATELMRGLGISDNIYEELVEQAWLLLVAEISEEIAPERALPATTWTRNWLIELLQIWRFSPRFREEIGEQEAETRGQGEISPVYSLQPVSDAVAYQYLRSIITTLPIAEVSPWLTALEVVLTNTSPQTSTNTIAPSVNSEYGSDKKFTREGKLGRRSEGVREGGSEGKIAQRPLFSAPQHLSPSAPQPLSPSTPFPISTTPDVLTEQYWVNSQITPIITSANNSILSTAEETAGLYISQAGLVLLHPFIRFYLEAVGLLNDDLFRDESAQQIAIYLMYYLATKQTDAPEYELVLPKLLCGWSLNQPVVRGLDLPAAALEEGEGLLQTVIDYWEVLKSTSPDGLREGFLQRQGKLTRSGDGNWKLQVEQQAIDVLLGSLPWGVSMVTLPWMEGLLMVEWH